MPHLIYGPNGIIGDNARHVLAGALVGFVVGLLIGLVFANSDIATVKTFVGFSDSVQEEQK